MGTVNFANVPEYLITNGLFCLWKYENANGRKTKIPFDPNNPQYHAASTRPDTFTDYAGILNAWNMCGASFDGVGVGVFNDVAAIDIDHCIDQAGKPSELAADIVNSIHSYAEISPSGEGVRVFFRVPPDWTYDREKYYINNRRAGLEIYVPGMTNKFLTFTGRKIKGQDLESRPEELQRIVEKYMQRATDPEPEKEPEPARAVDPGADRRGDPEPGPYYLTDSEIIDRAAGAANGDLFRQLWSGDITGYNSQSEADQALCNILAFWTGRDAGRIDQLYRQSGLMRDKWKRDDYRNGTINKAIRDCKQIYDPQQKEPGRVLDVSGWNQEQPAPDVSESQPRADPVPPPELPKVLCFDPGKELPPLRPEIITGILREGHKMLLAGQSKAGKSFDLIELALCFATGQCWHGFRCKQIKVLYVNMEIDAASFLHRVSNIAERMELQPTAIGDRLLVWNMRGEGSGITKLVDPLKKAAAGCGAVIIDPIYKVMEGDENSASEMALFTKNLDRIAESGAAVIFAHHFGKNTQGQYKDPMNRTSGSGVFARDPDAIITMSSLDELSISPEIREHAGVSETATGYQLDFTLREFPPVKPFKIWFDYPIHITDNGALSGAVVSGIQATPDEKKALKIAVLAKAFEQYSDQVEDDGGISLMFLDNRVDQIGGKGKKACAKTIRSYSQDSAGEFFCKNGKLYKGNGLELSDNAPFENETV